MNVTSLPTSFSSARLTRQLRSLFGALLCVLAVQPGTLLGAEGSEGVDNALPENPTVDNQPNHTLEPSSPDAARFPLEELQLFAQIFDQIRTSYVEEVDDKTLLENAIVGLLGELDPHSMFLAEESFSDLQENTSGEFGGIGIEVGLKNGYIAVISPIDDTPAARAGLQPGDLIIELNEQSLQGMGLGEAVTLMRGPVGSAIELTVVRDGEPEPLVVKMVRDVVKIASIRSRMLTTDFGYVRLAQFQEKTGADFRKALSKLLGENPGLKGVVLDLRNNPGGLLPASVAVADALLDSNQLDNPLIVYTEGRIPSSNTMLSATPGDLLADIPIVALINEGTASAAEIVAGALQDHGRALILGTESFGKGSVQSVLPLNDGRAVKLTTARYFTPKGRSIQADGIKPDIFVGRAEIRQLDPGYTLKESNLSGHLSNSEDGSSATRKSSETQLLEDNQLYEAVNLLKGLAIFGKSGHSKG
ncbi:MAG: S41 family peptidase [Porticoccaceae bacterium]|nr:S41 family peptidase [Porticoccaceae bacterium]